jgi:hypothetical protein
MDYFPQCSVVSIAQLDGGNRHTRSYYSLHLWRCHRCKYLTGVKGWAIDRTLVVYGFDAVDNAPLLASHRKIDLDILVGLGGFC